MIQMEKGGSHNFPLKLNVHPLSVLQLQLSVLHCCSITLNCEVAIFILVKQLRMILHQMAAISMSR